MRGLFKLFSRRQSLAAIATVSATTLSANQNTEATVLPLVKLNPKELLRNIALTGSNIFVVWSAGLVKGASRLACYELNGHPKWSVDLGTTRIFALHTCGDNEVALFTIQEGVSTVALSKFNAQGQLILEDSLSFSRALLAVAANASEAFALDFETNLITKHLGASKEPDKFPPAFDTPIIGGFKPPAIVASVHCFRDQVLLLDHVKARTVSVSNSGGYHSGQLNHPTINSAVERQDADVQSRAALAGSSANSQLMTFPKSIFMAASDQNADLWIVASLGMRTIQLLRFNVLSGKSETVEVQSPTDPLLNKKPPLALAASTSHVAFGYREGAVAIVTQLGGTL